MQVERFEPGRNDQLVLQHDPAKHPDFEIRNIAASGYVRLLSERIYRGPRDIFLTNGMWEGRRPNMVELFGEDDTAWLADRLAEAAGSQGHIVVRVDPGGETYRVVVLDDRDERRNVLSVHGPYQAGRPEDP